MELRTAKRKPFHKIVADGLERAENATMVVAIRNGLIMSIPVLMIGAFALILQNLPIDAYQTFLNSFRIHF